MSASFRVYVYRYQNQYESGKKYGFTLTFLTSMRPAGATCIHDVRAISSHAAKKLAAKEHRDRCGNRVTS